MKAYIAIGHFKDSKNTISVAMKASTKKDFMVNLYGNTFVPYVVLTESMVEKFRAIIAADDCFGTFDQVKKLTTNYRVWGEVTDYIEQCFDIIESKLAAAQAEQE